MNKNLQTAMMISAMLLAILLGYAFAEVLKSSVGPEMDIASAQSSNVIYVNFDRVCDVDLEVGMIVYDKFKFDDEAMPMTNEQYREWCVAE